MREREREKERETERDRERKRKREREIQLIMHTAEKGIHGENQKESDEETVPLRRRQRPRFVGDS